MKKKQLTNNGSVQESAASRFRHVVSGCLPAYVQMMPYRLCACKW